MAVLIVLLLAAAVFGVGAVLEGLLWAALIALALVVAAAVFGFSFLRGQRSRTSGV